MSLHPRALITGAAGGIGRCLAARFDAEGVPTMLTDVDLAQVTEVAGGLRHATARPLDVRDAAAWDTLAQQVRADGPIRVLVLNAGVTAHGPFAAQSADDLDWLVDVNLRGVLHGARAFLPQLVETGGQIIIVSSMASMLGIPTQALYSATKAATRTLAEGLAAELAPRGVAVTAVLPGTIATGFLAAARTSDPAAATWMAAQMQRWGTPPEVVAARIVAATRSRPRELRVGWDAHLLAIAQTLLPGLVPALLRAAYARFAPDGRWGRR
jgi:short-subunit dehydrogenase